MPDPKIFFWIFESVVDAACANFKGIKTLLVNGFSRFFINSKPVFSNGPKSLPKNLRDCPVLYYWVFDNFLLVD